MFFSPRARWSRHAGLRPARQFGNFYGHVQSFDHVAEDCMLVVKPRCWRDGDEKLASICVGPGVGHGKLAGLVMPQRVVELIGEAITGVAGSCPQGASSLNHELRDHAVERQAIIKGSLHFLTGARILEFLCALGKADKILDCFRRFLFAGRFENRSGLHR